MEAESQQVGVGVGEEADILNALAARCVWHLPEAVQVAGAAVACYAAPDPFSVAQVMLAHSAAHCAWDGCAGPEKKHLVPLGATPD